MILVIHIMINFTFLHLINNTIKNNTMIDSKRQLQAHIILKSLNTKVKFNIENNLEALGFTRQSYYNKVKELKEQKIINQFTININPNIHPINLKFVMLEIKTNPKEPQLIQDLLKIPQLKMLDGIFGEFSLIALFIFKSPEEYYQILNTLDKIMSKSYFKKYHIIEIIKVFKTNGIALDKEILDPKSEVDEIDKYILRILQENQGIKPISTYEIKEVLKTQFKKVVSQSTVHNRIKKLESNRIILNYTINFCPKKIGFYGKYLLRIKPKDPSKYNNLALNLMNKHFITDLFRIGEEYGLFTIVRVKKIEDYGEIIRNLYLSEEIEDTFTNFVLDELMPYTNFSLN